MNDKNLNAIKDTLRELAGKTANARIVLDYLKTYKNDMRTSYIDSMSRGTGLSEYRIREVFRQFEDLKLGELIVGRKGHRTRFAWETPLTKVAALALEDDAPAPEELFDTNWLSDADDSEDDLEDVEVDLDELEFAQTLKFPLRKDFELTLRLPKDLTAKDVDRLTAFLKTLPHDE